jgi:hypothetical protein
MANRAADLVIYATVGVSLVGLIYWGAADNRFNQADIDRWGGLLLSTAALIGLTSGLRKRVHRRVAFWIAYCVLMALRALVLSWYLWTIDHGQIWYFLVLPMEVLWMNFALRKLGVLEPKVD